MKLPRPFIAWITLALGIGAWGGAIFLAERIAYESEARVFAAESQEQSSVKQMSAIRTRALAEETRKEREALERQLGVNVIGLANIIENAGRSVGVAVRISDALPESGANAAALKGVGFVIEAYGSFNSLMHVAAVFETLPVPASVEQLEFEHISGSGGATGSWRLSARLRILSTVLTDV